MSIARALTKRLKASEGHDSSTSAAASSSSHSGSGPTAPAPITRSASAAARRIDRAQISLPVTLLSTSNVLAFEAPDLYPNGGSKHAAAAAAAVSPALTVASNPMSPAFSLPFKNPLSPAVSSHSPMSPLPAVSEAALSDASSTRSSAGDHTDASTMGSASTAPSSAVSSPTISREASPGVAAPALPELNHLSAYFPQHKARPGAKSEPKPPVPTPRTHQPQPPAPPAPVPKLSSPSKTRPRKPSLDTSVRAAPPAGASFATKPSPALPSSPFASSQPRTTPISPDAPAVPARTRAHTVQTHQALARQRSLRSSAGTGPPPPADSVPGLSSSARTSGASSPTRAAAAPRSSAEAAFAGHLAAGAALDLSDSPTAATPELQQLPPPPPSMQKQRAAAAAAASPRAWEREPHPFGAELEQVRELAEEIGVRIWDEEEAFLAEHGLRKFGAADYIGEIGPLFKGVFDGEPEEETTWL